MWPADVADGDASLPLRGVRVLDLSSLLAAPMAAMHLADFGADVIKVEDPLRGDGLRSWGLAKNGVPLMHKVVNRNKRCVTLDLRLEEGQDIARRLAKSADVIIENFRPGTLEGWGLGFEVLRTDNPRLVLARITGYGQKGPYSKRPGFGTIGEAFSGFAAVNGYPDRPPLLASFGLGDATAAIFAAFGVMVALHHARATGEGQYVDLSLYDGLVTLLGSHIIDFDQLGVVQQRSGSRLPFAAPRNTYRTADEQWVVIAGSTQRTFETIMDSLGIGDLCREERFATNDARIENVEALDKAIQGAVQALTLAEVLLRLQSAGAPVSPVFDVSDVLADPHMVARQSTVLVADDELGPVRMQNVVPKLSHSPGSVRWAGSPAGAHNRDVYVGELGLSDETLEDLRRRGVV